jgi:tRNA A-37 threonylcarbamoyl transferase component Bud32
MSEAERSPENMLPRASPSVSFGISLASAARLLRRQLWLGPLITAGVLAVVGWLLYRTVERSLQNTLADELQTILQADLATLDLWLGAQRDNASALASDHEMVEAVEGLIDRFGKKADVSALLQSPELAQARELYSSARTASQYDGLLIVTPQGRVLGAVRDELIGKDANSLYPESEFLEMALAGTPTVSRPMPSEVVLPDGRGKLRAGVPTMFACAPVRDHASHVIAALGLRIHPEVEFTRILNLARFGGSGETYAFNREGLLLSSSRFDADLKSIGLLPDTDDAESILTLRLRDPLVDLTRGQRTPQGAQRPLTHMAAEATAGHDGIDVAGYRDYRGVLVVGAWRWLPAYNFGVATEIDYDEAFQTLGYVRRSFVILFILLVLAAFGMLGAMLWVSRLRLALRVAAVKSKQLGQYTLEEKLGEGAMGVVYKARHAFLRRPTAVKLLHPRVTSDAAVARFEREVQLTSQLAHPNTVAIYDYGRTDDQVFYYAMEYLDGLSLEALVRRFGPQPDGRVVGILQQLCGSLAEAHGRGLIHRDIKPANLILNHRGGQSDVLKVLDFGLVKAVGASEDKTVTMACALVGTPDYMSPEAIANPERVDARSDLYAVGAVGYFLLTGCSVFDGNSVIEVCNKHLGTPPVPPSQRAEAPIAADLEAVILRCLEKRQEQRPQSADELFDLLRECCGVQSWDRSHADAWWAASSSASDKAAQVGSEAGPLSETIAVAQP